MGYLFLMTFAGSALFIGYLCWEKLLRKSMTQCVKYRALLIVMLVYIVPWRWVKAIYKWISDSFMPAKMAADAKALINIANIETKEIVRQTKEYQLLMLIMLMWFAISVLFMAIRVVRYLRKSHRLYELAINCEDENLEHTLKCLHETIRYRSRPKIVWTRVDNETFTIGTIRPAIFLQKGYADGDLYWILKHEMTHIIRMDLWIKLLLEFVCCLHWFNPLIYLLRHEIRYLCETSCDEKVIKGCTEEECQAYMDLLDRNRNGNRLNILHTGNLEGGSEIDKRIVLMKNRKSISNRENVIVVSIFVVLIFLDSLTALAYPEIDHVKSENVNVAEDAVDGDNFWIYDYVTDGYGTLEEILLYDEQFVDEKGEIYPVELTTEEEICSEHEIVPGVVQIHHKDSDGGCTTETYEGTRCTECGMVWKGNLLREARKIPCPH